MRLIDTHYTSLSQYAAAAGPLRPSRSRRVARRVWTWIKSAIDQLGELRVLSEPYEPRAKRKMDEFGNLSYQVYDPVSNSHHTFTSEEALRIWLDQRYYF